MKIIMPIAGESRRTREISDDPKCLLSFGDKTILEHLIDIVARLDPEEILFVIGYKAGRVVNALMDWDVPVPYRFCMQAERLGDGHAVLMAKEYAYGHPCLFVWGDHIIDGDFTGLDRDIVWVAHAENPSRFGVVHIDNDIVVDIEEKPGYPKSSTVLAGVYFFQNSALLFDALELMGAQLNAREIYFANALRLFLLFRRVLAVRHLSAWIDLGTTEAYLAALAEYNLGRGDDQEGKPK